QLPLLMDFSPEGMMANDAGDDAAELEAELMALVGGQPDPKGKPKGKTPLPMEAIERMAALCMKDLDEEEEGDDEEDLEDEDDLMAELQEVLGEGEGDADVPAPAAKVDEAPPGCGGVAATLAERAAMYRTAIGNAREAGDASKVRRYERGLKTLENMLSSARKGKHVDEQDIPPPVALGKSSERSGSPWLRIMCSSPRCLPESLRPGGFMENCSDVLRGFFQSFDPLLEAVGKGQPVDPSSIPPSPGRNPTPRNSAEQPGRALTEAFFPGADIPAPPRDALEALQQRMERYQAAAAQARGKGDDRKARMHERIVKQYQEAIRAHKAGKPVDFSELPVPPGFQPIQGVETPAGDRSLAGVLESAMKLASQELRDPEEEPEETKQVGFPSWAFPGTLGIPQPPFPSVPRDAPGFSLPFAAQQQLAFLEGRRKQLLQAALRAKQKNDMEGAKLFLRQAKGLEPMMEASRSGLPVDISKVPEAPVNKEDFVLVPRRGVSISPEAASQYLELMKLLRQQHEMCVTYSKQFTHLGNIAETTKFERMAEDCKQNIEILKQAHARGFPLPRYHYEQRTFTIVKIFPELNSNDMVLAIVKGINLPAPPGVAPNDLDAFVRFEFPYPNAEEAQKDKTNVIKNTDCPEFNEQFKLYINRGHRGLKRVLQTKGIKFEVAHKGGLFKTDRVVGTAQLKLEALEAACEVREIVEVRPGGRAEAGLNIVRIREPLSSQQLETRTERWLVINP
ncbi:Coiled-coil and C2 domain-containing protein 1A, partial [Tinamus guttatus]